MKKLFRPILFLFMSFLFSNMHCEGVEREFDNYMAVIKERSDFENSVKSLPSQKIVTSGKIYIKDELMFVNDVNKGFHVYNYSDPKSPTKIGFIQIPGATDMAIRDDKIFINQAVDLVTLNYNAVAKTISVLHRNKNVFPQKKSPQGTSAYTTENQIITDWISK